MIFPFGKHLPVEDRVCFIVTKGCPVNPEQGIETRRRERGEREEREWLVSGRVTPATSSPLPVAGILIFHIKNDYVFDVLMNFSNLRFNLWCLQYVLGVLVFVTVLRY